MSDERWSVPAEPAEGVVIKPCPFCGADVILEYTGDYHVRCWACGASSTDAPNANYVIGQWNRRVLVREGGVAGAGDEVMELRREVERLHRGRDMEMAVDVEWLFRWGADLSEKLAAVVEAFNISEAEIERLRAEVANLERMVGRRY